MAQPFPHTLRSLQKDGRRATSLGLLALLVAAIAWMVWLFGARVTVYETSQRTRLEVRGSTFAIHSARAGRLATVAVSLGQGVRKGSLLFTLDTAVEDQRLAGARARLLALDPQIDALLVELRAQRGAVRAEDKANAAAMREAKARSREAEIRARLAKSESRRFDTLNEAAPQIEIEKRRAQAEMQSAASSAVSLEVRRIQNDRRTKLRVGEAKLEGLRRELSTLQGEKQAVTAQVAELEQEIERHRIRAPSDGVVGELMPIQPGAYVSSGARLATLLPAGDLILIAEFEPAMALGRIQAGQRAELRLTGFPWLQFGTVQARVSRVAAEPRDGLLRVEFDIVHSPRSLIPFQHGQPGTVDVAVEQVSPATLILRGLGRRVDAIDAPPTETTQPRSPRSAAGEGAGEGTGEGAAK